MYKKKLFFIIIIFLIIIILLIVIYNNRTIDGSKGGILEGNSHENGGIPGIIKADRSKILLEGKEAIIDVNTMEIKDRYICEGNPMDIASALNELGGSGAKFGNGKCVKISN